MLFYTSVIPVRKIYVRGFPLIRTRGKYASTNKKEDKLLCCYGNNTHLEGQ